MEKKKHLHSKTVKLIRMTPSESENLVIHYTFGNTIFGEVIIGSSDKGICYLAFEDNRVKAIENLKARFPKAKTKESEKLNQSKALQFFQKDTSTTDKITLHIQGTDFQVQVWEQLLDIPFGSTSTYKQVAENIGKPSASRAIGTAIGRNPIAYIIPCHRVVQTSGGMGGYMWGVERKIKILNWEKGINIIEFD